MRKVTMVVPVLIMSCHESLKPKIGPVAAQMRTIPNAIAKAMGLPVARAVHFAKRLKNEDALPGLILPSLPLNPLILDHRWADLEKLCLSRIRNALVGKSDDTEGNESYTYQDERLHES